MSTRGHYKTLALFCGTAKLVPHDTPLLMYHLYVLSKLLGENLQFPKTQRVMDNSSSDRHTSHPTLNLRICPALR